MKKAQRSGKGTFSDLQLPVADSYLWPNKHRRLLWLSILGALILVAVVSFDFVTRQGGWVSGGPLSSSHAFLENECSACHVGFSEVSNEQCSTCHEKYGDDLGNYTFAAHYLYRSGDFQRHGDVAEEVSCAACHREHGGRQAAITRVEDARCGTCHEFSSFTEDHPPFEPLEHVDEAGLEFAHGSHVLEAMAWLETVDPERACLACHNPDSEGKGFAAIDFDLHCSTCHLGGGVATPRLAVRESPEDIGVDSLEAIQARGGAGTQWAFATNPNEIRQVGRRLSKTPVHHRDPWILENLRQLRQRLYPDAGLADLLVTSAEVPASEVRLLYDEAVTTLETYAKGLRGRPEVEIHDELEVIEGWLGALRQELQDPYAILDENAFLLALGTIDAQLPSEEVGEIEELVSELTSVCTSCHFLEQATLNRVQKDQKAFRRAEFDHRSHVIERRCQDCHYAIPIPAADEEPADASLDHAGIQNLPAIDVCQTCHTPELATDQCVTCHYFHPNKERHADLLLY